MTEIRDWFRVSSCGVVSFGLRSGESYPQAEGDWWLKSGKPVRIWGMGHTDRATPQGRSGLGR